MGQIEHTQRCVGLVRGHGSVQASEQWRVSSGWAGRASTRCLTRCGLLMRLVEWTVDDGRHHEDINIIDHDLHRCTCTEVACLVISSHHHQLSLVRYGCRVRASTARSTPRGTRAATVLGSAGTAAHGAEFLQLPCERDCDLV